MEDKNHQENTINTQKKSTNRGGKRPGSGRHKVADKRDVTITMKVRGSEKEKLREYAHSLNKELSGMIYDYIRLLMADSRKRKSLEKRLPPSRKARTV